jgi:hypothetical protein
VSLKADYWKIVLPGPGPCGLAPCTITNDPAATASSYTFLNLAVTELGDAASGGLQLSGTVTANQGGAVLTVQTRFGQVAPAADIGFTAATLPSSVLVEPDQVITVRVAITFS